MNVVHSEKSEPKQNRSTDFKKHQTSSPNDNRELNTNMRKTNTAELLEGFTSETTQVCKDLGASWLEVLKGKSFGVDLVAGLTVAAVALPLNLALAVACSLPPATGFVAGLIG